METTAESLLRWPDLVILAIFLGIVIAIGAYSARKMKSADGYFLANRNLPGWAVGLSMMATIASSLTFLALPGKTFAGNWEFIPSQVLYFLPVFLAYFIFMPFFRRANFRSAYEYLEHRFGPWARVYSASIYVGHNMFRLGLILYITSIPLQQMSGWSMPTIIVVLGVLVAVYTIVGGLEAVIYTDVLQAISLYVGGLICIPIITNLLPGGGSQLFADAFANGKFSLGNTSFTLSETTVWSYILLFQFLFIQYFASDQTVVQRYLAMKSDKEAKRGLIIGTVVAVPVWAYFAFVGTALWVFYLNFPETAVDNMEPEGVFTYFILTRIPVGLTGFVIFGILAAAMSSLDSTLNATAAVMNNDFYKRFESVEKSEKRYLVAGRWFTAIIAVFMIAVALAIHFMRNETLLDLMSFALGLITAGLFGVLYLAFFTKRIGSVAAGTALVTTVLFVALWVFLTTDAGETAFPGLASLVPSRFWIAVIPNLFLIAVALLASLIFPQSPDKNLQGLTVWTNEKSAKSV